MTSTLEASVFIGKNYSQNLRCIKNTSNNLTMKQMFDISEKLTVGQSDEIYGVTPINWDDSSWKHLSLIGDEEVISLSHAICYVFSDSVLCLGKMNVKAQSNTVWEDMLTWFKSSSQYRALDTIDGEPMEFEWNISQDSPHCSSATKSKSSCQKWVISQNNLQDGSSLWRCSNDISWWSQDNEQECELSAPTSFLFMREDFHQEDGPSSDLDQKRSDILLMNTNHEENWTESLNWWW